MLKILSKFFHGAYQGNLAEIPNTEYYHIIDKDNEAWDKQTPRPSNIFAISEEEALDKQHEFNLFIIGRHPEIIHSYNAGFHGIPRVFIEQTWPYNEWNINTWKENREKYIDYTVFITKSSCKAWSMREDERNSVIHHAIDVSKFPEYIGGEKSIITVCNEFPNRDWCCGYLLWVNSTWGLSDVRVYGRGNKNIGEANKGAMSNNKIKKLLLKAGTYFNPSLASPIPMSLLEAMACGTPVVSTHNCGMKSILQDGVNSLVANDASTLRKKIIGMVNNPERAKKIGQRGKELVKDLFAPEKFVYKWSKVFEKVVK
ncbi:MAG: glycosyltransferase family 4 protein [Candidatus Cloacimonetes bacterium]|nr:glycosyltransferase family 4 protein [Candidatus Cloacimonadota bacterium]